MFVTWTRGGQCFSFTSLIVARQAPLFNLGQSIHFSKREILQLPSSILNARLPGIISSVKGTSSFHKSQMKTVQVWVLSLYSMKVAFGFTAQLPLSRLQSSSKSSPKRRITSLDASLDVIQPPYELTSVFLALSTAFIPGEAGSLAIGNQPKLAKVGAVLLGLPIFLFSLFLAYQATTLRFTFDDHEFSLVKSDLSSTGENVVVGGENRWAYNSFVNYAFFPSETFPVLVYFKETQTPESQWMVGPGEMANSPDAIAKGAKPGQVHFFPVIGDPRAMKAEFISHGCAKI